MNINLDKKIENELRKDIEIPKSVLNKIDRAFEEIREEDNIEKSAFKFNKKLVASLVVVLIISGVIISPKVFASISSIFKDRGIQKATNNGYAYEITENWAKDSGITMNIDSVVADKNKIGIAFTLKFDDTSKLRNVNSIQLGLNIKDNDGRVFIENLEEGLYTPMKIIGLKSNTDISNKSTGEIKYYFTMYSIDEELDRINNLSINIDELKLYEEDVRFRTDINGEWKLSLDLDDKNKQIETIKYRAVENSDIVTLNYIEVMPTGSIMSMDINKKVNENMITNIILTDESGENDYKFTIGRMKDTERGVNISSMYDLTTFDNLDKLKIVVKDIEGEDIVLNLIKEDK